MTVAVPRHRNASQLATTTAVLAWCLAGSPFSELSMELELDRVAIGIDTLRQIAISGSKKGFEVRQRRTVTERCMIFTTVLQSCKHGRALGIKPYFRGSFTQSC